MSVVVLRSRMVGQTIAARLRELGHDVGTGEATKNAAPSSWPLEAAHLTATSCSGSP
jgi:hypothetical protein